MRPFRTAILIAGILVAGLAYNTAFAQLQPAEKTRANEEARIDKKIRKSDTKHHAKHFKHEKAKMKHHAKGFKHHAKSVHAHHKAESKHRLKYDAKHDKWEKKHRFEKQKQKEVQ